MSKLTIAKFGGSAIGIDGEGIPEIVKRIKEIQEKSKLVVVCSAPLTMVEDKKKSLTDVILGIGNDAANGNNFDFSIVEKPYMKILEYVSDEFTSVNAYLMTRGRGMAGYLFIPLSH